jgi:hypothetical protein
VLVKKIYTLSVFALLAAAGLTSCQKDYTCSCDIKYVVNGKVEATTTSRNNITATTEDNAKNDCKYYETEEDYLGRMAVVQHYCGIE